MAHSVLQFGPYTVDLGAHSLRRDGVPVSIQEQPFQILLALLDRPGQIVTREELKRRLWGTNTFVDFEGSLNSAVRRLRLALEDSPKEPIFVETLPRIGLRFLAEVRRWEPATAPDHAAPTPVQSHAPAPRLPAPALASSWTVPAVIGCLALALGILLGFAFAKTRGPVERAAGQQAATQGPADPTPQSRSCPASAALNAPPALTSGEERLPLPSSRSVLALARAPEAASQPDSTTRVIANLATEPASALRSDGSSPRGPSSSAARALQQQPLSMPALPTANRSSPDRLQASIAQAPQ